MIRDNWDNDDEDEKLLTENFLTEDWDSGADGFTSEEINQLLNTVLEKMKTMRYNTNTGGFVPRRKPIIISIPDEIRIKAIAVQHLIPMPKLLLRHRQRRKLHIGI